MQQLRHYGTTKDGQEVRAATLSRPGGLEVEIIEYGAIIRALRVPAAHGPVEAMLGFDSLAEYEADTSYHGCLIGRCANRIDHGRFSIDGQDYQVDTNEGPNTLHGGRIGWNKRVWRFEAPVQDDAVRCSLTYVSPDGEEGFPGEVHARVVFTLTEDDTLEIRYGAVTDRPTPVNLTHHGYFNLSGDWSQKVTAHELTIAGSAITPVRPDLIPTGELMPVEGTPFDLRRPARIGEVLAQDHPQLKIGGGIDHNWALDGGDGPSVILRSPESGVALHLTTDQPGVQVYSGQGLTDPFVPHGAIVFEPQDYPDAVNHPNFPNVVLRPGETYRHRSLYRFESAALG